MKYLFPLLIIFLLGCEPQDKNIEAILKGDDFAKPSTPNQKQSYALGIDLANALERDSANIELDYFIKGFYDRLRQVDPYISKTEFDSILTNYQNIAREVQASQQSQRITSLSSKTKEAKRILPEFLKQFENAPGFYKTETGLMYKILKKGDESLPTVEFTQSILCHMATTMSTGEQIDNTRQMNGGQPRMIAVEQLFDGLIQGILEMRRGDRWQIVIPPELAFGKTGDGRMIPGYVALVVDIEILDIVGN